MPPHSRPPLQENMRRDVCHHIPLIPLSISGFIRIRPAPADAPPQIKQHNRTQASALWIVTRPDGNEPIPGAARDRLRIHIHRRRIVRDAVKFLRPRTVRIHRPDRLADARALIDILPSMIHHPPVFQNHRTKLADRTTAQLLDIPSVGIHPMKNRRNQMSRIPAENSVFAARRRENNLAVRQITRMNIVGMPGLAPTGYLQGFIRRWK